jgi:hypothetical protein
MTSWMEKLEHAKGELAKRAADPLRDAVAAAVAGFEAVSTVAILTSIGLRPTTGNARRIARSMRSLGYIPIKSRRLPPGGWSDTLCRGWARPLREPRSNRTMKPAGAADANQQGCYREILS